MVVFGRVVTNSTPPLFVRVTAANVPFRSFPFVSAGTKRRIATVAGGGECDAASPSPASTFFRCPLIPSLRRSVEAANARGGRSAGGRVPSTAPSPTAGRAAERLARSASRRSREDVAGAARTSSVSANGFERVSDGTKRFSSVGSFDTPTPPARAARLLLAILSRARRSRKPALASSGSMLLSRARVSCDGRGSKDGVMSTYTYNKRDDRDLSKKKRKTVLSFSPITWRFPSPPSAWRPPRRCPSRTPRPPGRKSPSPTACRPLSLRSWRQSRSSSSPRRPPTPPPIPHP